MLSIFFIYSPDRLAQLTQTIECLQDVELYQESQKILCCDGKSNFHAPEFTVVEIPRNGKYFSWAPMWEAGVSHAIHELILYLDSDRIVEQDYLVKIAKVVNDNNFVFPKWLYKFRCKVGTETIKAFRDGKHNTASPMLATDHRVFSSPVEAIQKKNPMAGCVAFTKTGFKRSGGLDESFVGWGYPDIDYYMSTFNMGYEFVPIECNEFHLQHSYDGTTERADLMTIWNGVKFCHKWRIPLPKAITDPFDKQRIPLRAAETLSLDQFVTKYSQRITLL